MRHVPRELAKKLDRLSRRAHRFHRFAHHPLCGRYQRELLAIGRKTRICRGCAFACLGFMLGASLGLLVPVQRLSVTPTRLMLVSSALIAVAACAVLVGLRARAPSSGLDERPSKLVTRLLPASLFTCAAALAARTLSPLGLASCVLIALAVAALHNAYRRRGPDRTACASCPERSLPRVCSGLAPIVRRERAFVRLSRRLLAGLVL